MYEIILDTAAEDVPYITGCRCVMIEKKRNCEVDMESCPCEFLVER